MPAFIKTKKDEEVWQKARKQIDNEYNYSEDNDTYWKLVNSLYHKMRKNAELNIASQLFNEMNKDEKVKDLPDDILVELKQRNYISKVVDILDKQYQEILKGGIDINI